LGGFSWRLDESRIPIFIIDLKRKLNIITNDSQFGRRQKSEERLLLLRVYTDYWPSEKEACNSLQ
jgi:hypothetical protein